MEKDKPLHPNAGGSIISNDYSNLDYTIWFNGTSAACPHVAGVVALVLSVNQGLTQHDVGDIIANTAQKVGGYNYQPSGIDGRGTWHNEVGHGLVDAFAATQSALCDYPISNTTYSSDVNIDGCNTIEMENVSIINNSVISISNTSSVSIQDFLMQM